MIKPSGGRRQAYRLRAIWFSSLRLFAGSGNGLFFFLLLFGFVRGDVFDTFEDFMVRVSVLFEPMDEADNLF